MSYDRAISARPNVNFIKVGTADNDTIEISRIRLWVVLIVFAMGFVVVSLKIFEISLFSNGNLTYQDTENPDSEFRRESIVDRNGTLLAINLKTESLYANPNVILDKEDTAAKLAKLFPELNKENLLKDLNSSKKFVWIKRNLTPKQQHAVNSLGKPGLGFIRDEKRVYPHGNLMSKILGFVSVDGAGLMGIENKFNDSLNTAKNNGRAEELKLCIDIRVQDIVRNILFETQKEFKAKSSDAVVMDVNTGEIVAMVSLPDFDPHHPGNATEAEKFNGVTLGVYEMGSTFKTFNVAYALSSRKITLNDSYDVSEPIKISHFNIRDYHADKPTLTVPEIYMYSSNIGSAKMVLEAGIDEQEAFLRKLGLLDPIGIEVPEVGSPIFTDKWNKIRAMTIAFGHGIAVTPLHVAKATAILVNGGKSVEPTLIANKLNPNNGTSVVDKDVSDQVRKLMRFAVQHGTGTKADADGYLVGGKTGSADKAKKGKYDRNAILSSFVGVFPMNNPKYVVFVMFDEPKGNRSTGGYATGGMVAAPAVKKIIEQAAPLLGVQPVDETKYEIRKEFWYDQYKTGQEPDATFRDL